jgi:hypothetical protein
LNFSVGIPIFSNIFRTLLSGNFAFSAIHSTTFLYKRQHNHQEVFSQVFYRFFSINPNPLKQVSKIPPPNCISAPLSISAFDSVLIKFFGEVGSLICLVVFFSDFESGHPVKLFKYGLKIGSKFLCKRSKQEVNKVNGYLFIL